MSVDEAAAYLKITSAAVRIHMARGNLTPSGFVKGATGNRMVQAFSQADLDVFKNRKIQRGAKAELDSRTPAKTSYHAARRAAGIDRKEAAKRLDVNLRKIYRWESGEVEPDATVIRAMAVAYSCSVAEVLGASRSASERLVDLVRREIAKHERDPDLAADETVQAIKDGFFKLGFKF